MAAAAARPNPSPSVHTITLNASFPMALQLAQVSPLALRSAVANKVRMMMKTRKSPTSKQPRSVRGSPSEQEGGARVKVSQHAHAKVM